MTRKYRRRFAPLFAIALGCMGALGTPAPAPAMQILDAADHAELAAEISATDVNRIALAGDRIARVVRSPDGFAVEHDAVSGDLYLRPLSPDAGVAPDRSPGQAGHDPVTLFVGTERGFTYRLTLIPAYRDSAQILIRNAAALPRTAEAPGLAGPAARTGAHIAALVQLVGAVARRETLPGYAIARGGRVSSAGLSFIETWRGPRLAAHVLEADRNAPDTWPPVSGSGTGSPRSGPAGLAGAIGALPGMGRLAALWLAAPGTGPTGGRLVVAVTESGGDPR